MKKIVLAIGLLVGLNANSQFINEIQFRSIWNKYRVDNDLDKLSCDFQSKTHKQLTPNYKLCAFHVNNNNDTVYYDHIIGGDEKFIPKYHDKNSTLLFKESFNTKEWNGIVLLEDELPKNYRSIKNFNAQRYIDSIYIQKFFNSIIESEQYGGILKSNRKFYIHCQSFIDDNFASKTFYLEVYEVLDVTGLNIPADYGYTVFHADMRYLKPYMVDRKTKKLLYPELTKKLKGKK